MRTASEPDRTETGERRRGAVEHFYRATEPVVFDETTCPTLRAVRLAAVGRPAPEARAFRPHEKYAEHEKPEQREPIGAACPCSSQRCQGSRDQRDDHP